MGYVIFNSLLSFIDLFLYKYTCTHVYVCICVCVHQDILVISYPFFFEIYLFSISILSHIDVWFVSKRIHSLSPWVTILELTSPSVLGVTRLKALPAKQTLVVEPYFLWIDFLQNKQHKMSKLYYCNINTFTETQIPGNQV